MLLREQYQEHSERDYLSVPLATYHFEQVTIPLHWHREVELILPQEAGELELEGQLHPYGPQELLCVNQGVLHRTWAPIPLADLLVVDLDSLLSPLLRQDGGSFLTRLARCRAVSVHAMQAEDEYENHWDSRLDRPWSTSRRISPPTGKTIRTAEADCRNGRNRRSENYRTWLGKFYD